MQQRVWKLADIGWWCVGNHSRLHKSVHKHVSPHLDAYLRSRITVRVHNAHRYSYNTRTTRTIRAILHIVTRMQSKRARWYSKGMGAIYYIWRKKHMRMGGTHLPLLEWCTVWQWRGLAVVAGAQSLLCVYAVGLYTSQAQCSTYTAATLTIDAHHRLYRAIPTIIPVTMTTASLHPHYNCCSCSTPGGIVVRDFMGV